MPFRCDARSYMPGPLTKATPHRRDTRNDSMWITRSRRTLVLEVRNGLVVGERRGRVTEMETNRFLRELLHAPIALDPLPR